MKERYLYTEQASGARKDRSGFLACLEHLREGDSLVVWRLDRLARSLRHCIEVLNELAARQVHLVVLEGPFAYTSPLTSEGKLLYAIFAALAEFERDLIRDRVVAGLAALRARGRKEGDVGPNFHLSSNGWRSRWPMAESVSRGSPRRWGVQGKPCTQRWHRCVWESRRP